jgi:hypothetical protein
MRKYFSIAASAFVLLAGWQVSAVSAAEVNPPNQVQAAGANSGDLVREALMAEADGNATVRSEKLRDALAADQNSAAAHWLDGQIQIGDRWLSIDDAEQQAAKAGKMDEYRKQRDQRGATLDDHIALARLCAKLGLKEHERGHLMMALQLDPSSKEAISKLGLIRKHFAFDHGRSVQLFTPQQFELMKSTQKNASVSFARWTPVFQKLRRQYEANPVDSEQMLKSVRSLHDVDAIPSMEYVFGRADGPLALAAIDALKEISKQEATESLARYATWCENSSTRDAAITALRYRDRENYLPLMISALKAPVRAGINVPMLIDGTLSQVRYVQFQEGPLADQVVVRFTMLSGVPVVNDFVQLMISNEADRANAVISVRNERIFDALASISGEQIRDPADRWNWWFDQNEYQPLE